MKAPLTEKDRNELFPGGWKPVYWAFCVYAALVPVAYFVATNAPGRKDWPFWAFAAVMHALLSALVAAVCKLAVVVVEQWMPNSPLRPYTSHMQNFIAVLAVWPFCITVLMFAWKLKHG